MPERPQWEASETNLDNRGVPASATNNTSFYSRWHLKEEMRPTPMMRLKCLRGNTYGGRPLGCNESITQEITQPLLLSDKNLCLMTKSKFVSLNVTHMRFIVGHFSGADPGF